MNIRNALIGVALLASVRAFALDASPVSPTYLCEGCTATAYDAGARSLGPGRHVLFDFRSDAPRAFTVAAAGAAESAAVSSAPVSDEEKRRFDLSRRIWSGPTPAEVSEGELKDWLRHRNEQRTAPAVLWTSAYRNDLDEALQNLLPYILPQAVPAAFAWTCKPCPLDTVKDPPQGRTISVALTAGGSVDFVTDAAGMLRARTIRDASGMSWQLDSSGGIAGN